MQLKAKLMKNHVIL